MRYLKTTIVQDVADTEIQQCQLANEQYLDKLRAGTELESLKVKKMYKDYISGTV